MWSEPAIEVQKDDQGSGQWALGKLFYRKEGAKSRLDMVRIKWLTGILFAILIVFVAFKEPPGSNIEEPNPQIDSPEISVGMNEVATVPVFNEKNIEEVVAQHARKRVVKFSGLSVISRSANIKIPAGSVIPATLVSGASNGLVKAKAKEDFEFEGEVLIHQGQILLGSGFSTEERLLVRFTNLIEKNGKSRQINAQALDQRDKVVGLRGSKISRFAKGLAIGAGLNFITGFSEGLQEREVKDGIAVKKSSVKNALLNGATHASLDQSKAYMESMKDQTTVITVEAGADFYILFSGD